MNGSTRNRQTLLLLLATLLMRAAIPDGYMPAAASSGLLFELCPAGVPAEFMRALGGSEQHSHHHHASSDAAESHFDGEQCPIGHLLSSAAAVDIIWHADVLTALPDYRVTPVRIHISRSLTLQRSRGPPA